MRYKIIPFDDSHLPQAAELLAGRHMRDREVFPQFPARYEDPAAASLAMRASLQREHALGWVAVDGSKVAAYLIGNMVNDKIWGRSGWMHPAGCAYDPAAGVEIVRDLYATLGAHWVKSGVFHHCVQIPIADPALIQAWFSLSFGIEHIYALADLQALDPAPQEAPAGLVMREAGPADRQHLAELSDVIWREQVKAPCWAPQMPEMVAVNVEDWASSVEEADVTAWLVLDETGKALGVQGFWPAEGAVNAAEDNMFIPEKCAHMSLAGTRRDARNRGIGTLLTRHILAQARLADFRYCDTEWRSTNLLASRFWPRFGYQPVVYRLVRRTDPRISWADGSLA